MSKIAVNTLANRVRSKEVAVEAVVDAVADVAALKNNDGASHVVFTQEGDGAVPIDMQKKGRQTVSVMDFGADPTGVTLSDVAFQKAFFSTNGNVTIPAGTFRLSQTLYRVSGMITGQGMQTKLVFENMAGANGIVFAPVDSETTSGCERFAIYAKGSNGGKAISTPQNSVQYVTLRSSFHYQDLLIAGLNRPAPGTNNAFETIETWMCGIEQGDAWNVIIRGVDGYGNYRSDSDPAPQAQSCFIRLQANSAMLTARFTETTCSNFYRAMEIGNRCFFQISLFDFAHVYDGIYQTGVTPNVYGESKVLNGNINAQRYGIFFSDIGSRQISGVVVRRHRYGWKPATTDWAGIKLVNCNYVWITDCQYQPDASSGPFLGEAYGVQALTCGGVNIMGNVIGLNIHYGFHFDNCTMIQTACTHTFQADANAVIHRATTNTRQTVFGNVTRVSSFIGKDYEDDNSITSGAIQQFQRNMIPEGSIPAYYFRRSASAVDEKIWRLSTSASNFAIQMVNDAESSNVNGVLFNRTGQVLTSIDMRTPQLKLNNGPTINVGSGSPEGITTAPVGSTFHRTAGTGPFYYVKESGTGNTGWVGK